MTSPLRTSGLALVVLSLPLQAWAALSTDECANLKRMLAASTRNFEGLVGSPKATTDRYYRHHEVAGPTKPFDNCSISLAISTPIYGRGSLGCVSKSIEPETEYYQTPETNAHMRKTIEGIASDISACIGVIPKSSHEIGTGSKLGTEEFNWRWRGANSKPAPQEWRELYMSFEHALPNVPVTKYRNAPSLYWSIRLPD